MVYSPARVLRDLRSGSPLLAPPAEAVLPFHIVCQTAIVLAGHVLKPGSLMPAAAKQRQRKSPGRLRGRGSFCQADRGQPCGLSPSAG